MHEGSVFAHDSGIAPYACHSDKRCQLQGPDQNVLDLKFGLQVQVIIGASDAPESATCYAQSQTEARLT